MTSQPTLVLDRVLRVLRPLVRLLLRNGVTYTVLAAALKRVFVQVAQTELAARGMPSTDSAVTLLCGVHRRDVRELTRGLGAADTSADPSAANDPAPTLPLGLAAQVVARWMNAEGFKDAQGNPLALAKNSVGAQVAGGAPGFDALVAGVSSDVRPRAVLAELLRLGVVQEQGGLLVLEGSGFAPRQGFAELAELFAANVHDHAAAAAANLAGEGRFLEQAVFVDQITEASAQLVQQAAQRAWKQAFQTVMSEAQTRFDADAASASPATRNHRARFGVYFYSTPEDSPP
jgi:Family of unknown function (DUF6502)